MSGMPNPKPAARVNVPRGLTRRPMKKHLPKTRPAWVLRRDAHFAVQPRCQFPHALVPQVKCQPPYDAQHVTARGMGGRKHDTSVLVTLCRAGHTYTETNRTWARAHGLAVHLWESVSATEERA